MTATLCVSIINYRTAGLTIACVRSVLAQLEQGGVSAEIDGQIVVVDNASGDNSADVIEEWIAGQPDAPVRVMRSTTNAGFSGGHNRVLATCTADYVLVLNSDAELRPGCLWALVGAANRQPSAGLFVPRLEGEDGTTQTSCFRFAGPISELIRGACSAPVTALLRNHDIPLGPNPDPAKIEWASFACVLLRWSMIDQIGLLDDGYFLYFEDAEYCYRARRAGWQLVHVPRARVLHHRGGSGPLKKMSENHKRIPRYYYASRTRFLYQTGGQSRLILANLMWLLGRVLAVSRAILGKEVPKAMEAESKDIWTNILSPLDSSRPSGE